MGLKATVGNGTTGKGAAAAANRGKCYQTGDHHAQLPTVGPREGGPTPHLQRRYPGSGHRGTSRGTPKNAMDKVITAIPLSQADPGQ